MAFGCGPQDRRSVPRNAFGDRLLPDGRPLSRKQTCSSFVFCQHSPENKHVTHLFSVNTDSAPLSVTRKQHRAPPSRSAVRRTFTSSTRTSTGPRANINSSLAVTTSRLVTTACLGPTRTQSNRCLRVAVFLKPQLTLSRGNCSSSRALPIHRVSFRARRTPPEPPS